MKKRGCFFNCIVSKNLQKREKKREKDMSNIKCHYRTLDSVEVLSTISANTLFIDVENEGAIAFSIQDLDHNAHTVYMTPEDARQLGGHITSLAYIAEAKLKQSCAKFYGRKGEKKN